MACLMRGGSGRYERHQHDSAWHVQGYFYWWVIVSMVWGIIAAFIAIVMPVWEASAWRHHLCAEFPHEPHACMPRMLIQQDPEPKTCLVYELCESVCAGKGHNWQHHRAHAHLPVRSPLGRVP